MGAIGTVFSAIPLWVIVVFVLLVIVIMLLRTTKQVYVLHFLRDNMFVFVLGIFFVIFAVSLTHIHSTYDVEFNAEGISQIIQIYADWLLSFAKNIGKVTSYAIQQDWVYNGTSGGR